MDNLTRLVAIADVRSLMARRVRCLDEKDWAGFAACYADDARSYTFAAGDNPDDVLVGGPAIAKRVAATLDGVATVHQVHEPEIEIESETSARAIWPLHDRLRHEASGAVMRGFGHYRQRYEKRDGRWLIVEQRLTRLWVERNGEIETGFPIPE